MRISKEDLDFLIGKEDKPKKNKFNAKPVIIDGIRFHSGREGGRYLELKMQEHTEFISNLKLQVEYVLLDPFEYEGKKIKGISYFADFEYLKDGKLITEDSKGFRNPHYKDKKKMLLSRYPLINFIET